jgi:hypothetical protein
MQSGRRLTQEEADKIRLALLPTLPTRPDLAPAR